MASAISLELTKVMRLLMSDSGTLHPTDPFRNTLPRERVVIWCVSWRKTTHDSWVVCLRVSDSHLCGRCNKLITVVCKCSVDVLFLMLYSHYDQQRSMHVLVGLGCNLFRKSMDPVKRYSQLSFLCEWPFCSLTGVVWSCLPRPSHRAVWNVILLVWPSETLGFPHWVSIC